jgi:hypothetical protein
LTGERFFANISRYGLRTVGVGKWKE